MADPKEPHFLAFHRHKPAFAGPRPEAEWLNRNALTDLDAYARLFDDAGAARAVGEASSNYLYLQDALDGIQRYVPAARLIAVLRNPVDRAYSAFLHLVRDGRETTSEFATALALEPQRINANWSPLYRYTEVGRYASQIERYFAAGERGRLKIVLYDDLERDPAAVVRELFDFLGVARDFAPHLGQRLNPAAQPRSAGVQRLLASQHGLQGAARRLLRDDVRRLEALIGRDLAAWLAER
jgi:Sulfotransferase family